MYVCTNMEKRLKEYTLGQEYWLSWKGGIVIGGVIEAVYIIKVFFICFFLLFYLSE